MYELITWVLVSENEKFSLSDAHRTHQPQNTDFVTKVILLCTGNTYFLGLERTSHVRIFIDR